VQGAIDAGVTIIQTAGRSPDSIPLPDGRNLMQMLKDAGMIVIHKCMSIRHALTAERIGVDCISLGGFEYGGHMGNDDVTHWVLQPTAARKLQVPFLVSIAQHQHGSGMTSSTTSQRAIGSAGRASVAHVDLARIDAYHCL
jgi:NAD(P)H-dependent flavin oxidoreductase YrpB (nitropropane dioxygenase family)